MMSTPPAFLTPSPALSSEKVSKTLDPGFKTEIIKVEDSERVLTFLRKNFFLDEPLNVAIKLMEGGERCKELEEFSVSDIHQGLSVMAVSNEGQLMGVLLGAAVHKKDKEGEEDWSIGCEHPKFVKTLRFLYQMEQACDIFSYHPGLDSLYDVKILSVDSSCRGKGVGGVLTQKAFDLARTAKLGFLKIDCSSFFSSKIADKLGCKENFSMSYTDYKIDGKQVFAPPSPHTHFCIKSARL